MVKMSRPQPVLKTIPRLIQLCVFILKLINVIYAFNFENIYIVAENVKKLDYFTDLHKNLSIYFGYMKCVPSVRKNLKCLIFKWCSTPLFTITFKLL